MARKGLEEFQTEEVLYQLNEDSTGSKDLLSLDRKAFAQAMGDLDFEAGFADECLVELAKTAAAPPSAPGPRSSGSGSEDFEPEDKRNADLEKTSSAKSIGREVSHHYSDDGDEFDDEDPEDGSYSGDDDDPKK